MNPEALNALGYTAAGGLGVKLLDLLLKWHTGQHDGTIAEMETARKLGAELRDELRKQLEELRAENVLLDTKLAAAEREVLQLKTMCEKLDGAKKDAEAELRLLKKATTEGYVRGDAEEDRHAAVERSERRRRPKGKP